MKNLAATVLALAFCASPALAAEGGGEACVSNSKTMLSIEVKSVALSQVLDILAKKGGINYILADTVSPRMPVSINWRSVTLGDAWNAILMANSLDCYHVGGIIVVGRPRKI